LYPSHTAHHCTWFTLSGPGFQPAGRKPGPVAREQEKWNKVRLENPRKMTVNIMPANDSAGGQSMLPQYKVIKVTHLIMNKATMGPQWNTLQRLVEDPMSCFFVDGSILY